jgi:hypothetical protein
MNIFQTSNSVLTMTLVSSLNPFNVFQSMGPGPADHHCLRTYKKGKHLRPESDSGREGKPLSLTSPSGEVGVRTEFKNHRSKFSMLRLM